MRSALGFAAAIGLVMGSTVASADYPDRSISVMVPFIAGGGADVPARFLAAEMETILEKSVVVTNVAGAGGTVGATQLSNATPDGYSLGFMPVGTTTTQPHLKNTSYGADSWEPICMVASGPFYLVVADDSPMQSIDDLITTAKGDGLIFAGAGPGSMAHVTQMTLNKQLGIEMSYLPTKGGGDIATEMNGGRADATAWFSDYDTRFGWRALAILANERSETHPEVPTIGELGYEADIAVWMGLFAPAGTPDDVVGTLSDTCARSVSSDSFVDNMTRANRIIRYMDSAEFSAFFQEAFENNGELLREAGLVR